MFRQWFFLARKIINIKSIFLICLLPSTLLAGIQITGTRIIFPGNKKEVSVSFQNSGQRPVLIQSWVEKNYKTTTEEIVPFLVTPPLLRIESNHNGILRILRTDNSFPEDRESLFWFNLQEIPEVSKEENTLQLAVISRLKLFVRPAKLDTPTSEVYAKLNWKIEQLDHRLILQVINPTPYFITLASLKINETINLSPTEMVPPFGKTSYSLNEKLSANQINRISYQVINDFGTETEIIQATLDN